MWMLRNNVLMKIKFCIGNIARATKSMRSTLSCHNNDVNDFGSFYRWYKLTCLPKRRQGVEQSQTWPIFTSALGRATKPCHSMIRLLFWQLIIYPCQKLDGPTREQPWRRQALNGEINNCFLFPLRSQRQLTDCVNSSRMRHDRERMSRVRKSSQIKKSVYTAIKHFLLAFKRLFCARDWDKYN